MTLRFLLAAALPFGLAACRGDPEPNRNLAALDEELSDVATRNDTAAALNSALQDQITVDPSLVTKADDAVRPSRSLDGRTGNCATRLSYNAGWTTRLPADLPLYPGARVSEAAGSDADGCRLRAVSFSTSASVRTTLEWYDTKLTAVGFSAEHQRDGDQQILGGARRDTGYILFMTGRADGGTDVDLVANGGR